MSLAPNSARCALRRSIERWIGSGGARARSRVVVAGEALHSVVKESAVPRGARAVAARRDLRLVLSGAVIALARRAQPFRHRLGLGGLDYHLVARQHRGVGELLDR